MCVTEMKLLSRVASLNLTVYEEENEEGKERKMFCRAEAFSHLIYHRMLFARTLRVFESVFGTLESLKLCELS